MSGHCEAPSSNVSDIRALLRIFLCHCAGRYTVSSSS